MKHAHHDATKSKILRLKRTRNPQTKKPYTYAEIGERLGMKAQTVFYYVKNVAGCPSCLRRLR